MINEQDYVKTEKDWVITFTPKKKKFIGERERLKRAEYWVIDAQWQIYSFIESNFLWDNQIFEYWNYYHTKEQAQAVADLRRHVYKFPAVIWTERHYTYSPINGWFIHSYSNNISAYHFDWLPITATWEDREERIRLIERCYELNGYVTI